MTDTPHSVPPDDKKQDLLESSKTLAKEEVSSRVELKPLRAFCIIQPYYNLPSIHVKCLYFTREGAMVDKGELEEVVEVEIRQVQAPSDKQVTPVESGLNTNELLTKTNLVDDLKLQILNLQKHHQECLRTSSDLMNAAREKISSLQQSLEKAEADGTQMREALEKISNHSCEQETTSDTNSMQVVAQEALSSQSGTSLLSEIQELREKVKRYDGVMFNTNLAPHDALELNEVLMAQDSEILKLKSRIEELESKMEDINPTLQ